MHLLPPGVGEKEVEKLEQETPEFQIDELFEVTKHSLAGTQILQKPRSCRNTGLADTPE